MLKANDLMRNQIENFNSNLSYPYYFGCGQTKTASSRRRKISETSKRAEIFCALLRILYLVSGWMVLVDTLKQNSLQPSESHFLRLFSDTSTNKTHINCSTVRSLLTCSFSIVCIYSSNENLKAKRNLASKQDSLAAEIGDTFFSLSLQWSFIFLNQLNCVTVRADAFNGNS